MAASQQLAFAVRAINEAKGELEGVQRDIKGVSDRAEGGAGPLGKFGGALGEVAKIAGGFILAQGIMQAPGFFMDAARAAAEDEAATLRLEQALRNAGGAFDADLAKVNDRIAAGQKLAFSDDDVRDSFQKLLAATGDTDEALRRQTLAMDLARGAGIPLAQASTLLGKINAENVEVFKRMGITIGENATEADALAAVQAKFGGQSEAYAKSTAGQFEQLKIRMGEAKETLGAALLPVMISVAGVLADRVVPAIEAAATWISSHLGPAIQNLQTYVPPVIEMFKGVGAAILSFVGEDILPKVEAFAGFFRDDILPAMKEIAEAVLPPLQEGLEKTIGFIGDHKEILAGVAIVIGGVLVGAFLSWAVAAGAAAVATVIALAPVIAIGAALALLAAGIIWLIKNWDELSAKYPILGRITDELKEKFSAFADWITDTFVPAVQAIYDKVSEVVTAVIAFVSEHWDEIRAVIEPAMQALFLIISTVWEQIKTTIETIIGVIKGIVDVFMGIFTGDWQRAWDGVKEIVSSVWNGIKGTIENTIGLIKDLAPLILDAGKALGGALLDGLKAALSATAGFAGDVASAVLDAVKSIVNTYVIDKINSSLEFSIGLPFGKSFKVDPPDIPRLAMGGIVTRPTLALIGEAGPEAVVPLNRPGVMGNTYNVSIVVESGATADRGTLFAAMDEWLHRQLGPGAVQWGAA